MGTEKIATELSLVVFTCEGREHLLHQTIRSFNEHCEFKFTKIVLAIDGEVNPAVHGLIQPDLIVQQHKRLGYVQMISRVIKSIETPFFFWLEDDWVFRVPLNIDSMLAGLIRHANWSQIVLSKFGPLTFEMKKFPLEDNFYQATFGFSANPCLCRTTMIRDAFQLLSSMPKGASLGHDGFENFLTRHFDERQFICAILDPINHAPISHEGYLETTPRNWHMTNSLEQKTGQHLMTIPEPSFLRRLLMVGKLLRTCFALAAGQLFSNKIYEHAFRVVTSSKMVSKNE